MLARWLCWLMIAALFAAPAGARDLQLVLSQTKAAVGGPALDGLKAIRLTYRLRQNGLEGTGTTIIDVVRGRFATRYRTGPISGAEGFDGRQYWMQDTAGIVTVPLGGDRPAQSVSAQFRQALAQWYPARAAPARVNLRLQLFRSRVKEALEIAPRGGLPFEMWFDAQTKLLDRVIEVGATETRTTSYEDYRPVGALVIAHRIRTSNAAAAFGAERSVTKVELNPAIADSDFAVPPAPRPDFLFLQRGRGESRVPFRFVNNHIYVGVRLNGRPFSLLVDTGAANVMTPSVARALQLRPEGDARVWGAGESSEQAAFVRVKTAVVGGVRLNDQLFAVVPLERMSETEGVPFHGMIGYELFKRFIVRVDYRRRELVLRDRRLGVPAGAGTEVPFVFNSTVPEIAGDIDGVPATFDIDTGSRASVGLHSPYVQKHALRARFVPNVETVTGWGIGGPTRGAIARVKRLRLGPIGIGDVVVDMSMQRAGVLTHTAPSGSIGSGLLQRFTVTFDYAGQRIYFLPAPGAPARDPFDRAGLWINVARGGFRVDAVIAQSPAAEAGLKNGDVITAIDGVAAASLQLGEVRARLATAPVGTLVRFSVRSAGSGALREISIRLRDLI